MISPLVSLLILAGFMGIHSITTVSKVSVKVGDSISIPCLYDPQYIDYVKYLCKGYTWNNCIYAFKTNQQNSKKYSITDDKIQSVFTVTVKDLKVEDTDYYWCAVEKKWKDVREYFQLSVTTGIPNLYVDQQEIIAFVRGSVTVRCYNDDPEVEWCRLGSSCVTSPTGYIDETRVTINSSVPNVFDVTMSELKTESSGWYLCVNGQFQMPVHVTVRELPLTTSTTTITKTARTSPATTQHSSLPTSAEPYTTHPTNSTMNGTESVQEHNSSTKVTIFTTTLVILLLVCLLAVFFGWRVMMRRNKTKPEGSNITMGAQIGSDPDEHYAIVVHTQHAAAQQQKYTPEESVTYSTIVMKDSVQQMTEPDGSVIYSTLHTKTE